MSRRIDPPRIETRDSGGDMQVVVSQTRSALVIIPRSEVERLATLTASEASGFIAAKVGEVLEELWAPEAGS